MRWRAPGNSEIRLVQLFEKRILCGNTIDNRLRVLRKHQAGKSKKAQEGQGESHNKEAIRPNRKVKRTRRARIAAARRSIPTLLRLIICGVLSVHTGGVVAGVNDDRIS